MSAVQLGAKYGMLVTTGYAGRTHYREELWYCECDCGNTCTRTSSALLSPNLSSCGCYTKKNLRPQGSENNSKAGKMRAAKRNKDNCNVDMLFRDTPIKTNTSGVQGVAWSKTARKWHVYVGYKGYRANLSFIEDLEDAKKLREKAIESIKEGTFEDFYFNLRGKRLEETLCILKGNSDDKSR